MGVHGGCVVVSTQPDESDADDLPEHVVEALPGHVVERFAPWVALYEYEEKHLSVEFEVRYCEGCDGATRQRIERDHYRDTESVECPECGVIEA